jgi:hypothetical protein
MMALLYHPGYDPTRVYEGTDTRAFQLLLGAALAMRGADWFTARLKATAARNTLDAVGLAGLVGIALLVWRTKPFSPFLYPDGLLLLSLATAAVIAAAMHPSSRLTAALGWGPLRWLGVRSYGIYLWQWPLIVLINPRHGPLGVTRAVLAVAGAVGIAAASWRYLENPIRHGALERLWRYLRARRGRPHPLRRRLALSGTVLGLMFVPLLGLSGLLPVASDGTASGDGPLLSQTHALLAGTNSVVPAHEPASPRAQVIHRLNTALARVEAGKSSCRSAVYIGDSTSEGEISSEYIPDVHRQLVAQLHDVGVAVVHPQISGARSIVETYEGFPNAATVARGYVAAGYRGCWILAMGTNDVADVHVGSNVPYRQRIDRMMSIIGDQPVLWVDVVTLVESGPYSERYMQQWNQDLLAACRRFPNMRIFDWSAFAKRRFFIPDGIHYYSPGYIIRSFTIAHGLANAFPQAQPPSASCVVS